MQYYLVVVDIDSAVVDVVGAGVLVLQQLLQNKCPSYCERKSRCVGDFVVGGFGVVGYNSNLDSCCCCLRREKRKIRESRLRLLRRCGLDLMRMMLMMMMRTRRWWRMCEYWIESECDFVVVVVAPVAVACVSEWQIVVVDAAAVVVGVLRFVVAAAAEHPYFQQVILHSSSNHFQNSVD